MVSQLLGSYVYPCYKADLDLVILLQERRLRVQYKRQEVFHSVERSKELEQHLERIQFTIKYNTVQ